MPTPFVVRFANVVTEGKLFVVTLTLLVGGSVIAGAWAIGIAASDAERGPAVMAQDATPSPRHTGRPSPTPVASMVAPEHRYVVRGGDTLADIARLVYGDETLWPIILEANRDVVADPDELTVGTSLLIPNR